MIRANDTYILILCDSHPQPHVCQLYVELKTPIFPITFSTVRTKIESREKPVNPVISCLQLYVKHSSFAGLIPFSNTNVSRPWRNRLTRNTRTPTPQFEPIIPRNCLHRFNRNICQRKVTIKQSRAKNTCPSMCDTRFACVYGIAKQSLQNRICRTVCTNGNVMCNL